MISWLVFGVPFLLFVANLGSVFNLGDANIFEKSAFLASALVLLLIRPFDKLIIGLLALVLGMILFLAASTTWPGFSWMTTLMSLNQFVIIYIFLAFRPTENDARVFTLTLAFLPVIAVVLGMIYQTLDIRDIMSTEWASGLPRLRGSLIPAFLSGVAMCGTYAAAILLFDRKKGLYLLLIAANFVILLLAGGRTALVVAAIAIIAELIFNPTLRRDHKFWMSLCGIAALPLFALTVGMKVAQRFGMSGDNGRELMWTFLDSVVARYPYTGIGFGHQMDIVPKDIFIRVGSTAAHNDFLRLSVEIGTVGMILFYAFLTLAVLRASINRRHVSWGALITYGCFLLLSYSDNALATPPYFPLLILAVVVGKIRTARSPAASSPRLWRSFPEPVAS